MRLTVIGATGMVGRRVTAEALARRHQVVAVSRTPAIDLPGGVATRAVDAHDREALGAALRGTEAVVLSARPAPGAEGTLPGLTAVVLDAVAEAGTRLLVIGGAGPLRSPAGGLLLDDPSYVAPPWRAIAAAGVAQLRLCRDHPSADWTYLSPPALLEPGRRTGTYRRGTGTVLTDPAGRSRISAEDLAVAVVDELEGPGGDSWFTVAEREP